MKPIAIDQFCSLRYLSHPTFAPDGTSACYVVTEALKEENRYKQTLFVRKSGKDMQLTSGGHEGSFCYIDSDTVLFAADREEKKEKSLAARFYKISLSGGEAQLAFTLPVPTQRVIPLPNGDYLALCTTFPGYEDLYRGDKKLEKAYLDARKAEEDYEVITQNPWWWNGGTFTRGAYTSLMYYHVKKKKLEMLSARGMDISDVEIEKDGKTVYFAQMDASVPMPDHFGGMTICRMDLDTHSTSCIVGSREGFRIGGYALGKSFMLLLAMDGKYGMNTDHDFFKLDYKTGEITPYALHGEAIGSSVGSDVRYGGGRSLKMEGDICYFISTRFDGAQLYKLEEGVISPVIDRPGSVDSFDVCGGNLIMVALYDMKAQELYDGTGRQLSRFNEKALRGTYVAKPEPLNFERGGQEIHGFVLKPMGFEPGTKYPVILDIHGGPKTVYGPVFYHEMQHWAGKGYFVIYCNPTGSDGRGAFMNILGKYGTVDFEDIMAFCDAALAAYPEMDRENFFETGGSYGGFMTNWIIGHTDRFRACVSQRSISNWISFYGVADIGVGFAEDQNATRIWPSAEKMWQHSPLAYADRVKTPTLFIHSFEDYRCPIDQGYQMYTALVAHGVETKMVLFRGENHELSRSGKPQHRIRRLKEITDWFDSHRTE